MARVVWSKRATAHVSEIIAYIRQDDLAAAEEVGARLIAVGESLAEFPHRGRPVTGDLRELTTVWPYVLRYRVRGEIVTIVRVRHGRRRPTQP
ncbi:MAG TPA: type II toxin-antitoxin system RelE/ParE family toxin [Sphingomonas sp.]|jgi:addiction module RelE/StbE family toxin